MASRDKTLPPMTHASDFSIPRAPVLPARALRWILFPLRFAFNILLARAIERANVSSARALLFFGANPNARFGSGLTPLTLNHSHSDAACSQIALSLLLAGARPNAPARGGLTPLHYGAQFALPELCQTLFLFGADPGILDADGLTPLGRLKLFNKNHLSRAEPAMAVSMESLFERHEIGAASPEPPSIQRRERPRL